ncbi:hypothetical protein DQQ10_25330 [Pseudochryseolinea flava]|uniref:GIY-YIG domain-containing protein n=2 Tax=Pseudochryseolinea flava TaxID=2059302 RepID=A0A364XWF8_9BACT|nr:hypothetical protein DQQ10_25330 [Pseudochryseolinea flava]
MHHSGYSAFTAKAKDWSLYLIIEYTSKSVAMKIERHIKLMKSRKYIENLLRHKKITEHRSLAIMNGLLINTVVVTPPTSSLQKLCYRFSVSQGRVRERGIVT